MALTDLLHRNTNREEPERWISAKNPIYFAGEILRAHYRESEADPTRRAVKYSFRLRGSNTRFVEARLHVLEHR
jgi:hypothetical protein